MIIPPILTKSLIRSLCKRLGECIFELGSERVAVFWHVLLVQRTKGSNAPSNLPGAKWRPWCSSANFPQLTDSLNNTAGCSVFFRTTPTGFWRNFWRFTGKIAAFWTDSQTHSWTSFGVGRFHSAFEDQVIYFGFIRNCSSYRSYPEVVRTKLPEWGSPGSNPSRSRPRPPYREQSSQGIVGVLFLFQRETNRLLILTRNPARISFADSGW